MNIDTILNLSSRWTAPVLVRHAKLVEESGEFAEAVNHKLGYLPHKTMKEPAMGEVADVIICVLDTARSLHLELSDDEFKAELQKQLDLKSKKWETVLVNPSAPSQTTHCTKVPMAKFKMTKQEMLDFNDACMDAAGHCPQGCLCEIDDRDILQGKVTPKQLVKHWLQCDTLWEYGYDECLGLDALEVFKEYNIWKALRKAEKITASRGNSHE